MDTKFNYTSVLDYVWIVGTITPALCLVLQGWLFATRPKLRHVEQNILMQLTVVRLVLTFIKLFCTTSTTYMQYKKYMEDAIGGVYLYMVTALACLMVVYVRNLRDQVASKSTIQQWNFTIVFVFIWRLSILAALYYFVYFCFEINSASLILNTYVAIVVLVMTYTVLYNCKIICLILTKTSHINFSTIFKRLVISFLIACLVDVSIIMKYFTDSGTVAYVLSVFNSFQILAMTVVFVIPVERSNTRLIDLI